MTHHGFSELKFARVLNALEELVESQSGPEPGAIGRDGTLLVGVGFARRLGLYTYAANSGPGEYQDRWIKFEITRKGKAFWDRYAGKQ